jgi:hypothetical protein
MKKFTFVLFVAMMVLAAGNLLAADPVVVDTLGVDCEWHYYVHNSLGPRIAVDESGDVHVVYNKSWATAVGDTGFALMYKNVTTGTLDTIPQQQPEMVIKPTRAFIGGGRGDAPLFIYYGISTYSFQWGDMPLQALAEVDAGGNVVAKGMQTDKNYYHEPYYALPISMEVDATGIAHCIGTNVGGSDVYYFNADGTTFGEIYQMYFADPANSVPGKDVPGRFRRNATKGADLAVTNDGQTVAVGGLHPWSNIDVTYASLGGELWPDNFETAVGDGSFIMLFDTTNATTGDNFTAHNIAKPATDLQLAFDDDNVLHIVYEAAWFDHYLDTLSDASFIARNPLGVDNWFGWDWMTTYFYLAGDTNAVYYGTGKPKPQIRYWNSNMPVMATSTDGHTKIAESVYPLAGEEYKWWSNAVIDSGVAYFGNRADCIIAEVDLIVNKDPQAGEPKAVVVWEEMMSAPTWVDQLPNEGFVGYYKDIMVSYTNDFVTWSAPVNLTNTADVDEGEVSVYQDIIDNKVHFVYNSDDLPMADYFLRWSDAYADMYTNATMVRKNQNVSLMYMELDLTPMTNIDETVSMPGEFNLAQNYPNPFNPTTTISYTVPSGKVTLDIYNVLGQKINTLVNSRLNAGTYDVVWNGTNAAGKSVATGIYLYRLKSDAGVKVKKMLFQK